MYIPETDVLYKKQHWMCTFQFQPAIVFLIIGVMKKEMEILENPHFPTIFGVSCRRKEGVHR